VVGVPRSGTTLLRLMLDAHPQLAIPGETHFIPKLIRRWRKLEAVATPDAERRRIYLELITTHPRWPDLGIQADALERHLEAISPLTLAGVARAVHVVHAEGQGKPRWGDKTPRYLLELRRIKRALPEATFVHLIRDGRDVALSLRDVGWGTDDAAEAAERWSASIRAARRKARRLAPGSYLEVRYEQLVSGPEPTLRAIAEFAELPWHDAMLAHHEHAADRIAGLIRDRRSGQGSVAATADERAAQLARVDEPPRTDRVERWRAEMAATERRRFEAVAGDLLEELGYASAAGS
jgi:hypothetical protein